MSLLSGLFSTQKTPSYAGIRPVSSLNQVQGGPDYYNNIMSRLAGRGVGYGDDYTSLANPAIANMKNNFESYQIPELESQLSATGRRAGSGGSDDLRRAYQEEGLNENSLVANLMQRNAEASHTDVNNAFSALGSYAGNEASLQDNAANFDANLYGQQSKNIQYDNSLNNQKGGNLLVGGAELAAAPFTGGASLGMGNLSNPFGGNSNGMSYGDTGFDTGSGNYGSWKPSTSPSGYNLNNMRASLVSRQGQLGRVA